MSKNVLHHRTIRKIILTISLCTALFFAATGCQFYYVANESTTSAPETAAEEETTDTTEEPTTAESTTADATIAVETTVAATTAAPTPTEPSETTRPPVVNTATMYSSYAIMKSFDPETGLAKFDYFDMLTGQDAIDWLVNNEGYTPAEAEEEVNNYMDGEFFMKNINPQLRTVDLVVTPLEAIHYADGSQTATWPDSESISYEDFVALYELEKVDPDGISYVMKGLFYWVTVEDDVVTEVKQVYWC